MKKLLFLITLILVPMLASADDNQQESLYGEWRLVGWNDGGIYFEVDTNYVGHRHLSIEIPREGYVMAYSMVNEIFVGLLTLNGNEMIFGGENQRLSTEVYCNNMENLFFEEHICDIKSYHMEGNLLKLYYTYNDYFVFTSVLVQDDYDYRPFIEEGKVWVVKGAGISPYGYPLEPWIEYCYFDGDTIIGGQTCKQMKFITNDNPSPRYIGVWYEQDKKVYFAGNNIEREDWGVYFAGDRPQFELLYDFTLSSGDTIKLGDFMYIVKKTSGDITGFKGTYYDVGGKDSFIERWFEGVGSESWPYLNQPYYVSGSGGTLLACVVGDEVIYLNGEYEDGATLEGARKGRFDFTHTIKTKPKAPTKRVKGDACISLSEREVARPKVKAPTKRVKGDASFKDTSEMQSLYGEYSDQRLGINLDPLDDVYQVCITDELGQVVYEKTVNAGTIVGLDIDISSYAQGRYTVIVENSQESFTGEFETQTTGIEENVKTRRLENVSIYNLQGQRISSLQKGLNIVNGHKIYVK